MLKQINKHKRPAAIALLSVYLSFIALTIIHYHHIDLQEGNGYGLTQNTEPNSPDPFNKQIDLTHDCTVQLFSASIINFSFIPLIKTEVNAGCQKLTLNDNNKLPARTNHSKISLRAPPVNS